MAATGKSKTTVWRWQERFAEAGVDGLLADKTRPPGKPPIAAARVGEVLRLTQAPPPHEATHWTARAMAKVVGLAVATVQKIWESMASPRIVGERSSSPTTGPSPKSARHRRAVCQPAGACGGSQRR